MDRDFIGEVIEWRGPAPYYFVSVPEQESVALRAAASAASYGWGMLPIRARIGSSEWTTSLWPKDGGYLLPLKDAEGSAAHSPALPSGSPVNAAPAP